MKEDKLNGELWRREMGARNHDIKDLLRKLFLATGLFISLSMAGCSAGNRIQMSSLFSIEENASQIDVYHYSGGGEEILQLKPEEIESIRAWFSALKGRKVAFPEGEEPGDMNGGQVFVFVITGEEISNFSYFDVGEDECYLLVNNTWYEVLNPSMPPITQ